MLRLASPHRRPAAACSRRRRENIEAGYLPLPTDLTFGGLVKEYFFDTYG